MLKDIVNRDYVKKLCLEILENVSKVLKLTQRNFYELSESDRMAIRYYLIVIAEALIDLALHISRRMCEVEGMKTKPETPIVALRILRDKYLIQEDEFIDISKFIKLRDLLVHRYWVVDDKRIYDSIRQNFKKILNFIRRVQELCHLDTLS